MISIDAVRAAVLSDEPWTRLDELVRAELASGRTTKQIFAELRGMAKEVRDTPGLSEDGEDAFGDTLDALVGFCSAKYAYHNPPTLPSEEEIAELPRWARVAFAARCARRVLPLYAHYWDGGRDEHRQDVSNAVDSAEASAARGEEFITGKAWAHEAANDTTSSYASFAAGAAAEAAASIDGGLLVDGSSARQAAAAIVDLAPYIRRDFDHLARLAQWQHWTDDDPVSPEIFGPMWPEGPPNDWPVDRIRNPLTALPLAFVAREGILPRVLEDEVVNLFNALNRYYMLRTGDRLTVDGDIHTLLAVLHPAGVS